MIQNINWTQNATLVACGYNGVNVHLFEVMDAGEYVYCGRIELVDKPYTETQPGEDGAPRKVWMFPIRPVPDNDVKKPAVFVFKDMDDFKARGKDVDEQYMKMVAAKKKLGGKSTYVPPVIPKPEPKPPVAIPADIVGKQVKHKSFGVGIITAIEGGSIVVEFDKVRKKNMGYEFCMENKMLEFIWRDMKIIRVVAAVIRSEDKIFATARGYGEFKGKWEFPGGKIEPGETPEEALAREIKEELETVIEVGELIHTVEYDYPTFHLSMDCFWCEIIKGNLVLKEAEDARWLTKDQLYDVKWLPADITLIGIIEKCL